MSSGSKEKLPSKVTGVDALHFNAGLEDALMGNKKAVAGMRRILAQMGIILEKRPDMKGELERSERSTVNIPLTPNPPQLPGELLSIVIHHVAQFLRQAKYKHVYKDRTLYQCTLVNKRFNAIANPLLWQEIHPFNYKNNKCGGILGCLSGASPHLSGASPQRLSILGGHIHELHMNESAWKNKRLLRLLPHIPNVKKLVLWNTTHITDASFQHVPKHCPNLTSLELHETQLDDASFTAIGQHCHKLTHLRYNTSEYSYQSLEWISSLSSCPLEDLGISDVSSESVNIGSITTATQHFDRLTRLSFKCINSLLIKSLLSTTTPVPWPHLTSLELTLCSDLDDETFSKFIKSHPQLEQIELEDAKIVTDLSLKAMATSLTKLTHIKFVDMGNQYITSNGIRQLVIQAPSLVNFDSHGCKRVGVNTFPELAKIKGSEYKFYGKLDASEIKQIKQGGGLE